MRGGLLSLGPKEREIYDAFSQGATNSEIAKARNRSPKTVESQLDRIADKLGFSNIKELRRSFFVPLDARQKTAIEALHAARQAIDAALAQLGA